MSPIGRIDIEYPRNVRRRVVEALTEAIEAIESDRARKPVAEIHTSDAL